MDVNAIDVTRCAGRPAVEQVERARRRTTSSGSTARPTPTRSRPPRRARTRSRRSWSSRPCGTRWAPEAAGGRGAWPRGCWCACPLMARSISDPAGRRARRRSVLRVQPGGRLGGSRSGAAPCRRRGHHRRLPCVPEETGSREPSSPGAAGLPAAPARADPVPSLSPDQRSGEQRDRDRGDDGDSAGRSVGRSLSSRYQQRLRGHGLLLPLDDNRHARGSRFHAGSVVAVAVLSCFRHGSRVIGRGPPMEFKTVWHPMGA